MHPTRNESAIHEWLFVGTVLTLFVIANVAYCICIPLLFSVKTLFYIFVLEFAAIGSSFHLAEVLLILVLRVPDIDRLDSLHSLPRVALLCVTCDDVDPISLQLLKEQNYDGLDVFVLDDSQSEANRSLVDDSGLRVVRRSNRGGFKAGNLNNWLFAYGSEYKYFIVADADSRFPTNFVETMVHHAEHPAHQRVAIIESLIQAWNTDSRFARLLDRMSFLKQAYGLKVANRCQSTLSVGHNNLYRTDAVLEIGGFTEDFLAEDFATSLKILATGYWTCKTVPVLSYERQPANIAEFTRRQSRWAYQTFQLLNLDVGRINWSTRFELLRSFYYHSAPVLMIVALTFNVLLNALSLFSAVAENAPVTASLPVGTVFWLLWISTPIILTGILAGIRGISVIEFLSCLLLQVALFTSTSTSVMRQVFRFFSGVQFGFVVTGRTNVPSLAATMAVGWPVVMLAFATALSSAFNPSSILNLAWAIPAACAPFIIHYFQRCV